MKLANIDNREPKSVRVRLPATVHDLLQAYLAYNPAFSDVNQLAAEILRAFTEHGDNDFRQWYKTHGSAPSVKAPPKKEKKEKLKNGVGGMGMQENGNAAVTS